MKQGMEQVSRASLGFLALLRKHLRAQGMLCGIRAPSGAERWGACGSWDSDVTA
jgi:hypothetical protein